MLFKKDVTTLLAATALVAGTALALPAFAQNASPTAPDAAQTTPQPQTNPQAGESAQPSVQAPEAASNYPDTKLKSFAVAFLQVDKVTKEYLPRLKQASSEDEQKKIRSEASGEMVKAVEGASDISVEEYNSIAKSAQTDPKLANKLTGYIREAAK